MIVTSAVPALLPWTAYKPDKVMQAQAAVGQSYYMAHPWNVGQV